MKIIFNIILLPFHLIYQLFAALRNILYDCKIFKVTKLPCKIISVGNITTGGTGKTPTVIALAELLIEQNKSVAILSRGYGRNTTGTQLVTENTNWENVGDEPALMVNLLAGIPIVVDENRIRGGQYILDNFNPDIIILDDGFQHRKLYRDLDVVLVNSNSLGYDSLFGFPIFRESWNSLKRAHIILLSKSNLATFSTKLQKKLTPYKDILFKTTIETSANLLDKDGRKVDFNKFKGKKALMFSGIGDPRSFKAVVQGLGLEIIEAINFRDHHKYSQADIDRIESKYFKLDADLILTTEKDLIKVPYTDLPIYSIPVALNIDKQTLDLIFELL